MTDRNRRQELYDRIRESSKDELILEEMIRLGFWPDGKDKPEPSTELIRRKGEIERELRGLRTEWARVNDEKRMRKELLKKRLAESRRKRAETKERRLHEKAERAAAWRERMTKEVPYLGDGVSAGLSQEESDRERLEAQGLPVLATVEDLAQATGLEVGHLRFLTFHRKVSQTTHYQRFAIPKKTGGVRVISAPRPRLKWLQEWILRELLVDVPVHEAAHGFVAGRSIVTNATAHCGAEVLVNLDLADFFPTLTYRRVKGLFRSLGYSESLATIFGLACTEPEVTEVELDGRTWHVHRGERHLPQGAPTSPAITNLICRRLDARVTALARDLGFTYTRYADDFSFSSPSADADVGRLLGRLRRVLEAEGFVIHPEKTRVLRRGRRQEVTGLVINSGRPTVPRPVLRRFRAVVQQAETKGLSGLRWGSGGDVLSSMHGFAAFVKMVDGEKGGGLLDRVSALHEKHGRPRCARKPRPGQRWGDESPGRRERSFPKLAKAEPRLESGTPQVEPSTSEPASAPDESSPRPWWMFWKK
ncbi:MAG: reverse transcriptase domain-containing protein [Acidobacteriota bacterium]